MDDIIFEVFLLKRIGIILLMVVVGYIYWEEELIGLILLFVKENFFCVENFDVLYNFGVIFVNLFCNGNC